MNRRPTTFEKYITEVAADYYGIVQTGVDDTHAPQPQAIQDMNSDLAKVIRKEELTPYIALDRVRRYLVLKGYQFPQAVLLDKKEGVVVFEVCEFGSVVGANIDGSQSRFSSKYNCFLWFEYAMNDDGYFNIAAVLVDQDDLDALMSQEDNETEEEDDDEHETGNEFDKRKLQDEEVKPEQHAANARYAKWALKNFKNDDVSKRKFERLQKRSEKKMRGEETINELSPATLQRYKNKSEINDPFDNPKNRNADDSYNSKKMHRAYYNRNLGWERASKRLGHSYNKNWRKETSNEEVVNERIRDERMEREAGAKAAQFHKQLGSLSKRLDKVAASRKGVPQKKWSPPYNQAERKKHFSGAYAEEVVNETLPPNASAKTYIHDFVHSKNKRFKGDSKAERIKRALGAFYHHEH